MSASDESTAPMEDVSWERLDKRKFFFYGAGLFSSVTTCLYPLSVLKTKQMALPGVSRGMKGVRDTAGQVWRTEGVPGFYRGFGTVLFGTIPARVVYLTTLEYMKSNVIKTVDRMDIKLSDAALAGTANFIGGGVASFTTQAVTVPVDVISQKQVVHGDVTVMSSRHVRGAAESTAAGAGACTASTPAAASAHASAAERTAGHASTSASSSHTSASSVAGSQLQARPGQAGAAQPGLKPQRIGALRLVRQIVQAEGVAGLYRGFGASVATFVPSSAVWWGAYGAYQKAVWHLVYGDSGSMGSSSASSTMASNQGQQEQQQRLQTTVSIPQSAHQGSPSSKPSTSAIMAVQTTSSVMAGCTSALVTTPLDLIKTRIQIAYRSDGPSPTFSSVLKQILREEGPRGLLRGATPRMLNASLWGTCMVTVYEFLKRICTMDAEGVGAAAGLQTTAATPLLRGA